MYPPPSKKKAHSHSDLSLARLSSRMHSANATAFLLVTSGWRALKRARVRPRGQIERGEKTGEEGGVWSAVKQKPKKSMWAWPPKRLRVWLYESLWSRILERHIWRGGRGGSRTWPCSVCPNRTSVGLLSDPFPSFSDPSTRRERKTTAAKRETGGATLGENPKREVVSVQFECRNVSFVHIWGKPKRKKASKQTNRQIEKHEC